MDRILITPRSLSRGGHPALALLEAAGYSLAMPAPGAIPDEAALIAALPGCVGWLAGVEPVSERVLEAADRLRVISRNGTGVDNLPLRAIEDRGIELRRAEGTNARGVAELALALTLAGLRQIVWTHEGMRNGQWPRQIGREMCEATIGIVGLGAIGATLAQLCLDLGAKVRGYDPFANADRVVHPNFVRVDLDEAITGVDAVSLHAPMPADGRPLMTAERIGALAPATVLVNTARAGLVDAEALLRALDSGRVACYATDVFETEPPAPSLLLDHPKVVLTSHIGGFTDASVERSTVRAVTNLLDALARDAH
ncbi:oxidoreductase [Kaistia sp. 32K]|uniref:NAD(P)-dependent oxidoreductase n=1 Tax=Kaistia sp. 32K TaxID=2795690 RepID=UPI00191615E4|nr:NAD(P)-dependent oxidoreductase [Kaistia sp. 32K]BCP55520.1 oxidoreductase [Kaistia sp. 32K]